MPEPGFTTAWLVTDVPFWQRRNGSHQRIVTLAEALSREGIRLTLWWIGPLAAADRQALERLDLFERITGPAMFPAGWGRRLVWHLQGLQTALNRWLKPDRSPNPPAARSLDSFRNRRIGRRFAGDLRRDPPGAVLIEYLSLAYLAEWVPGTVRDQIRLAIDTHDVMHLRAAAFRQAGLEPWLEVDRDQEARALIRFDWVVAIQDREAAVFKAMLGDRPVCVCKHAVLARPLAPRDAGGEAVRVGFLGGAGEANARSIEHFVRHVWAAASKRAATPCQLVISGGVADLLDESVRTNPEISVSGHVNDLARWYQSLDVVVNPVRVGSGLKIKSVEALAYGRVLVTTDCGLDGMEAAAGQGAQVAASDAEMVEVLVRLIDDRTLRRDQSAAADRYIRQNHHPEEVFRELAAALKPPMPAG